MRKLFTIAFAFAFALGTAGALAACGGGSSTEDAIEDITGGQVDIDDDSITFENEDGSGSFGTCDELPEGFPTEDVPVPDATPTSCSRIASDGDVAWSLTYSEGDADAIGSYKSAMEDAGFEITGETMYSGGDGTYGGFQATKGNYQVTVAGGAGGGTGGGILVSVIESPDASN